MSVFFFVLMASSIVASAYSLLPPLRRCSADFLFVSLEVSFLQFLIGMC